MAIVAIVIFPKFPLPHRKHLVNQPRLSCLCLPLFWAVLMVSGLFAGATFTSAQEFELLFSDPMAKGPRNIMRASDGAFYGTARGGPANNGTIFRVKPGGPVETLWSFRGTDGADPWAALVEGSDGYLYGTTTEGGAHQYGTVFRMGKDGSLTTLASFNSDLGTFSRGRLIETPDGSFLGVAASGGAAHKGTIFKVAKSGELTVLDNFSGWDGASPRAGLVRGGDGNYYGTTDEGGTGRGTIFRLTPEGNLTTLRSLQAADGIWPSELLLAQDGNFYGTTQFGGANNGGTFFKVTRNGEFTVLASFSPPRVASFPGQLVQDVDGAIYGALDRAVFKYTAAAGVEVANDPRESIDYDYWSGLVSDGAGAFVATTTQGEGPGVGRIIEFKPPGAFRTVARFGEKGAGIGESLAAGDHGEIYGTTATGVDGYGSIFQLSPAGEFSTVHAFSGPDGYLPQGGLVRAKNGSFYGTTTQGGEHHRGTVFKFTPGTGTESLHTFPNEGSNYTDSWLTSASNGSVYGVTRYGGAFGYGTMFRIGEDDTVKRIAELDGSICRYPDAPLVEAADGSFYGTAQIGPSERVVFRLESNGQITRIASLVGNTYGTQTRMVRSADGAFYGYESGTVKSGRIFKLTPTGEITTVAVFSPETGTYPRAGMVEGLDGFLYGTTYSYDAHGFGTIFRASRDGEIVVLHSFDGKSAAYSRTTPVVGRNGHIYGAADPLALWRIRLNHAPSAEHDQAYTRAGQELIIDVLANDGDPDEDALTVTSFSQGEQGGFLSLVNGRVRYVARPSFVGTDTFHYTIGDGWSGSATGEVTVNVAAAEMLSLNTPMLGAGQESSPLPAGAVWSYFGSPAINDSGTVAMFARWKAPSGRFGGIVGVAANGDVNVFARIGDRVPGVPGARFASFMDPLIASDESVAFRASIAGAGVTRATREVICWSDANNHVEVVACAGNSVPVLRGAKISRFASLALASGGEVLFRASLSQRDTVNEFNDDVLLAWSEPSKSTTTLIREGQFLAGLGRVRRFTTLVDSRFAPGADRGWFGCAADAAPWSARLRVEFTGASPRLMEWQIGTGVLRVFMTETSDPSGQSLGAVRTHEIVPVGLPCFSPRTTVVSFRGVTPAGEMAIYRQEQADSAPEEVCSVGQSVPDWPGGHIATISDPAGAPDATSVTWLSRVHSRETAFPAHDALFWANDKGLRAIARTGAQAADCEPGTQWKRFTSFAVPGNGSGPVFIAELRRPAKVNAPSSRIAREGEENNTGLWAVDSTAQPRLFLREGETIGGVNIKRFRLFQGGRGASGSVRAYAAGGNAVLQILGTDRITHILPVAFP